MDLHTLGWHSFQQLCLTIAREVLGQTVESFLDSRDAGRDGAFAGTWTPAPGDVLRGRFVIQCKFTNKPSKTLQPSDLSDEVEKVKKLVNNGRCDCYILMTNAGISGTASERIEEIFVDAGVKQVRSFGSTWIFQQIRENKRLRMLVPCVYGLGDLSQILDERAYSQAKALLSSLREGLSRVVLTGAYRRAAEALDKHGFVLLIGEPATGKTTIASMLSMAALDQWDASTLKLDDPKDVVKHWNPDDPSQFFWIDDAFGVMQYESFLAHGWNHVLPMVTPMLRKGAKLVMTSRDYIYRRARNDLKEGAFPLLRESQVVIDVRDLTLEERQQILYNHIKLGKQPKPFRTAIKPHLPLIAAHPRFVPETARRLADPLFTSDLYLTRYHLSEFVEKRELLLLEVLNGLDPDSKAALALIYMRNDSLDSPIELQPSEREALERLGSNLAGCITALEALNGSLVQRTESEGNSVWRFRHPTVGDAYANLLLQSPELLSIYVRGSSIDKLVGQVTCGDVGLEHAVPLPRSLFPLVLDRLEQRELPTRYKSSVLAGWHERHRVDNFLSYRCSKEFLARYIERHPEVLEQVSKPGLLLSAVSEVDLAIRLHEVGLLPEQQRRAFVETVMSYAIDGEDLYALESARIQSVFTEAELAEFHSRARNELLPKLSDIRYTWQSNADSEEPDASLRPLLDAFAALKQEFADEPDVVVTIERQIAYGEEWIAEKLADDPKPERPARTFGDVDTPALSLHRGIFDDVDE